MPHLWLDRVGLTHRAQLRVEGVVALESWTCRGVGRRTRSGASPRGTVGWACSGLGSTTPVDRGRGQVVLSPGGAARRTARSGLHRRRALGRHCGRRDREPAARGLRLMPVGGSGGGLLTAGGRQRRACAKRDEEAGCEMTLTSEDSTSAAAKAAACASAVAPGRSGVCLPDPRRSRWGHGQQFRPPSIAPLTSGFVPARRG